MFDKNSKKIKDIEEKIQDIEDDINFIHELLQPSPQELIGEDDDDYYAGETAQIPGDIYDKIREYCENKNFIFMGIA